MFSLFTNMSQLTDAAVANLLDDRKWVEEYLCKNILALRNQVTKFTAILEEHAIPFIKPTAAFFIWVDLRKWMPVNPTHDDEMDLWRDFLADSLLISPGCAFHCKTPGWFRIVYAFDWGTHFAPGVERFLRVLKNRSDLCLARDVPDVL
jgi:aspartate/methionine/tyrosine aminotransferase